MMENLQDYVAPWGKQGCFVMINNFQGVNIPSSDYPVVLRHPKLMAIQTALKCPDKMYLFWVPDFLHPKNGSVNASHIIHRQCHISKYIASFWEEGFGYELLDDYCMRLMHHLFASAYKPWRCEAQLGLFPALVMYTPSSRFYRFPRTFQFEAVSSYTENMLSLSGPVTNVFF